MQRLVTVLSVLIITAFLAGCGGSSSTTAATTTTYSKPDPLNPAIYPTSNLMGGAFNGGTIVAKSNYSVSTFAGTADTAGFTNYTATLPATATFNHPVAITTDGTNLYVADYNNNAIRQIDSAKKVTTLTLKDSVGNAVTFYHPSGITTDGRQLFVADSGNNVIRIITYSGVVTTTIGSATGVAGSVDTTDPLAARFSTPLGITTDGKRLYVTDTGNHTIRMIDITSKAVTTLAGAPGAPGSANGPQKSARFNMPAHITTDMNNLYLTDFNNRTIRSINLSTGEVDTLAGIVGTFGTADTAAGITATFYHPNGITTDGTNLYVTDYNDTSLPNPQYWNTVRKIEISTKTVTTIAGGISSISPYSFDAIIGTNARFANPIGITMDKTSLYVADSLNNTIRKIE